MISNDKGRRVSRRRYTSGLWSNVSLTLFCGIAVAFLNWRSPPSTGILDRVHYDFLLRHFNRAVSVDERLVFFMIDDSTLDGLQEFPLTRSTHTRLLRGLETVKAGQVVWDIMFDFARPDDQQFAEAMRSTHNFLPFGVKRINTKSADNQSWKIEHMELMQKLAVGPANTLPTGHTPHFSLTLLPQRVLSEAAQGGGHIAATLDSDGVSRRVPLVVQVGNQLLPSLGLAAVLDALHVPRDAVTFCRDGTLCLQLETRGERIRIPLDEKGNMLVNFVPDWKRNLDVRSYGTQLNSLRDFPGDMAAGLAGKTVVVGVTYSGSGDFVATPVEASVPGALVTLNVFNTIVTQQFVHPASRRLVFILTIVAPVALGLFFLSKKLALTATGVIVVLLGLPVISAWLFHSKSFFLPCGGPLVAAILSAGVLSVRAHVHEHRRATQVSTLLSRFISPTLFSELNRTGTGTLLPSVKRQEVSVMFIDIAGFTAFTDTSEPEEISDFLEVFYQAMMEELSQHSGTLDKFLGDGVLAYFGAPDELPDKECKAASAALAIQKRFGQISAEFVQRGGPILNIRCGITTGYVTVGYLGGEKYAAYTVVGRPVNLASRLQTAAQPGQTLLDKHTAAKLEGVFDLTKLGEIQVKGVTKPVEVFALGRHLKESTHGMGRV